MKKIKYILIACTFPIVSKAEYKIPNKAVYANCISKISQRVPGFNSKNFDRVDGGEDPISLCLQQLKSTLFKANNQIRPKNNHFQKQVLKTFHSLHTSWFFNKTMPNTGNNVQGLANKAIFDTSLPAAYFTKALFDDGFSHSDILTNSNRLTLIRENQNIKQAKVRRKGQNVKKSDFIFTSHFSLAGNGILLGIDETTYQESPYQFLQNEEKKKGQLDLHYSFGGGLLGSQEYLLMNVDEDKKFKANGALKMPRKWARSFYHDMLCRELPVVHEEDTEGYVVATSDVEFRKLPGCVQCHVTMDRAASTLRNFRYRGLGNGNSRPSFGGIFAIKQRGKLRPAVEGWPAEPTPGVKH